MIKVGIVDDNRYILEGWKTFIDYEKDMCVVDTYPSCEDAFDSETLQKCDIIIMDISLPGISGIEGVKLMRDLHPQILCIMATVHDEDEYVFEALKYGAVGYLTKKITPDDLIKGIRDAFRGGSPITPHIARRIIEAFQPVRSDMELELSERELEILQALATGMSYKKIAKSIYLSVDGVRHHIRNVYKKLEVNNRSEAVSKGILYRLIEA